MSHFTSSMPQPIFFWDVLGCTSTNKVGPSTWHQSFKYKTPFWCKYQAFHDDRSIFLCRFKIEFGAELRKPLPTPTDQMAFSERFNKNIEGGPRPTMKKTYRYIPSEQGRESDPIFHLSRGAPMSNSPNVVIPVDATKAERRGKRRRPATRRPVLLYVRLYESSIFRDKNEGFPLPALPHDSKVIHLMTEMGYDP